MRNILWSPAVIIAAGLWSAGCGGPVPAAVRPQIADAAVTAGAVPAPVPAVEGSPALAVETLPAAPADIAAPAEAAVPAAAPAPDLPAGPRPAAVVPLTLTVYDAIMTALENNRELEIQRLTPAIQRTLEDQATAAFAPLAVAAVSQKHTASIQDPGTGPLDVSTNAAGASASLTHLLSSGTTIGVEADATVSDSTLADTAAVSRVGVTVTQPLLQGAADGMALVSLRQARIDTAISGYALRGYAEALVAEVQRTYWDYYLALRQIAIYEESLALAQQHVQETRDRIEAGTLAAIELVAAQAEAALDQEALINARGQAELIRLKLVRLLNPGTDRPWDTVFTLGEQPVIPEGALAEVALHVQAALRMRADLNEARLAVTRGDLEVARTRNGLLPKLDLFIRLGKTGYADAFAQSARNLDDDTYDVEAGLTFQYPLGGRGPAAQHNRAMLSRRQSAMALQNMADLVQFDVRAAYIEVGRTREQVTATAATRKLQDAKLLAEQEKFAVGKSTTFLVAQAQRDAVQGRSGEQQAAISHLKALIDLFAADGTLLVRLEIAVPGGEPAVGTAGDTGAD
ncbi:MAG: TolC family protein [Planctomycetota bacterium]